jgi:hypothetical protein
MSAPNTTQQLPRHRRLYTCLAQAVEEGDLVAARAWLKDGASPDETNDHNVPVLVAAAKYGQRGIVELLLNAGATLDAKSPAGENALHWAACRDHADIASLLLDRGLKIDEPGNEDMTPLIIAAFLNSTDVLSLLIKRGADLTPKDDEGFTALGEAIKWNNREAADIIKAEIAARDATVVSAADKKARQMDRLRELSRKHKTVFKNG